MYGVHPALNLPTNRSNDIDFYKKGQVVTKSTFNGFTFGTASGEWTFKQGEWPAINFDVMGTQNQPTKL